MKTQIIYHVFTNNTDEYVDTLEEAQKLYEDFITEYGTARVYEEVREVEGDVLSENCILTYGEWPL
jgi:hypothetical protein